MLVYKLAQTTSVVVPAPRSGEHVLDEVVQKVLGGILVRRMEAERSVRKDQNTPNTPVDGKGQELTIAHELRHGQKGPGVLPALSIESVTSGGPESLNGGQDGLSPSPRTCSQKNPDLLGLRDFLDSR